MCIVKEEKKIVKRSYEETIDAIDLFLTCQRKYKVRNKEDHKEFYIFHIMTKLSLLSNGEEIDIKIQHRDEKKTELIVTSSSRWKMSIWDFGANSKNLKKIFEGIEMFIKQ